MSRHGRPVADNRHHIVGGPPLPDTFNLRIDENCEIWRLRKCTCGRGCTVVAMSGAEMLTKLAGGDYADHNLVETFISGMFFILWVFSFVFGFVTPRLGHGDKSRFNLVRYFCSEDKSLVEAQLAEVQSPTGPRLVLAKVQSYYSPMHHQAQLSHSSGELQLQFQL